MGLLISTVTRLACCACAFLSMVIFWCQHFAAQLGHHLAIDANPALGDPFVGLSA
jgi:hypothetical protein